MVAAGGKAKPRWMSFFCPQHYSLELQCKSPGLEFIMKNILITGGAGYVGSHTVLELKERGFFTVVLDDFRSGYRDLVFSDHLVQADVADYPTVLRTLQDFQIDAVIHFAAFIEAGESMKDPGRFFTNNTSGSLQLLEACKDAGVHRLIFSSTAAVYGFPEKIPVSENAPLTPVNFYGESKYMVEKLLQWYSRIYGINSVALRYFNAAGADPDQRTGELHNPETHLIPIALQTAYGMRNQIQIHGTDYNTPDGSCIRDYVHVSDLARAHVLALNYLQTNPGHHAFNVGTERGTSVREIIESVQRLTGRQLTVVEGPRRAGDPDKLVASAQKIKAELGWKPDYIEPDEIISTAHLFYQKYFHKNIKEN